MIMGNAERPALGEGLANAFATGLVPQVIGDLGHTTAPGLRDLPAP